MKIENLFRILTLAFASIGFALSGAAQDTTAPAPLQPDQQNQTPTPLEPMDQTPVFRVNVVGRTTKAVNYHFRSGATKVDLKGTDLMAKAHGTARVESHPGRIGIDATVDDLDAPQKFGDEYLTYVLWAITPEGRASNLGEFLPGSNRKISVTTGLQAFGLIVTAEPYFGVTQPSDVVVMENTVRPDTVGASEYIDARYELIGRGQYIPKRAAYQPPFDPKIPIYLQEARNAVRIAQLAGAEQYASGSFQKATTLLQQAEDYQARRKPEQKPIATVSREAVQAAEDARVVALRRREEERIAKERQAAADREAAAHAKAEQESQLRATAEQQAAESARQQQEAERQRQQAQASAEQAARAQAEAEQARQAALQQQQAAQAAAQASEQQRLQAERDREEMRARLLQQLNTILETRDTARGLIVNMSDVLFDTGSYTLRPLAREKLAKISGIVLAYPGLKLDIEGHTDSVGSDAYNQRLSVRRAEAVRAYLAGQSVPEGAMSATGFGKSQPIAPNTTAKGRQQNRRVELVVSGEVIGTKIGSTRTQPAAPITTPTPIQPPPPQPR